MLKGNKGEWSEIYAFCYLLSKGILRYKEESFCFSADIPPPKERQQYHLRLL